MGTTMEDEMDRRHSDAFVRSRFAVVVAGIIVAVFLTSAFPAEARVLERQRYSGSFSVDEVNCGRRQHIEGTFTGVSMLKAPRADLPPRLLDNYDIHEVFTEAGGDGYIIDQTGLYSDLQVRHVRGSLYRYTAINAGQVFTIRTLGGKAVYRNRGLLKFTFLVDTLGDSDYGNDVFLEDTLRLLRVAGKHPILTASDEEYCAVIDEAIRG